MPKVQYANPDAGHALDLAERVKTLEGSLQEMIDVMAPTIRSEMNLTQAQSSARIRAIALLKR